MDDATFPILVALQSDESGYGYLLRAASANGVTISVVRRFLGIGDNERIRREHAPRLSHLFGCDPGWLLHSIPQTHKGRRFSRVTWYGHAFRSPTALRLKAGQICSACLKERDYLRSIWDLSLYAVCSHHHVELSETCRGCSRRLQWNRQACTWCACGRFLGSRAGQDCTDLSLLLAHRIIEASFDGRDYAELLDQSALFNWLRLSPSGWHDLLMAFGLIDRPYTQPAKGAHLSAPNGAEARRISSMAMNRLRALSQRQTSPEDLSPLISQSFLRGLILNPTTEQDRQVGLRIHEMLHGASETALLRKAHPELSQLSLFGFE